MDKEKIYDTEFRFFFLTCSFHRNFASRVIPRYLAVLECGITILSIYRGWYGISVLVKLTWTDFWLFRDILHFFVQVEIKFTAIWSFWVDSFTVLPIARIAVSSAKVAIVKFSLVGTSLVYKWNQIDPSIQP